VSFTTALQPAEPTAINRGGSPKDTRFVGRLDEEFLIVVLRVRFAKKGHYVLLMAPLGWKSSKDWRRRTIAFGFGPLLEQLRV